MRGRSVAWLLWLSGATLGAQSIRGTLVSQSDTARISNVVVTALDSTNAFVARALTNERGEFRLVVGRPGSYRVRVLRIGYKPALSDAIVVAGEDVVRQIALPTTRVALDTVRVVTTNTCEGGNGLRVYEVWEQARSAMFAARVASASRGFEATTLSYERLLEAQSRRVTKQELNLRTAVTYQPWQAVSAATLSSVGYIVHYPEAVVFYAPDLDVLSSDRFLEEHCLRVSAASDASRIGVEFEPAPHRSNLPEIRGVAWLDRKSAELQSLTFRYANVDNAIVDAQAGGSLDFVRFPGGIWAITRWSIQTPGRTARVSPTAPGAASGRFVEVKVTGGELVMARRGRDTLWSRPTMTLTGEVVPANEWTSIANARVALVGTSVTANVNPRGRFGIRNLLPGVYTLEVRTASLDSVASPFRATVEFTDSASIVKVAVPSARDVLPSICPPVTQGRPRGLVSGYVTYLHNGAPVIDATVAAEWMDLFVNSTQGGQTTVALKRLPQLLDAETDSSGAFHLCGVPINTAFALRTPWDTGTVEPTTRIMPAQQFIRADVRVDSARRTDVFEIAGYVIDDSTKKAVANAELSLDYSNASIRSDSAGRFTFRNVSRGVHVVSVRRVGYAPLEFEMFPGGAHREVVLTKVGVVLASMAVTAKSSPIAELEEHRRFGIGHAVTRETFEQMGPAALVADVVSRIPGLRMYRPTGGTHAWAVSSRGSNSAMLDRMPDDMSLQQGARPGCYANVYIDGAPVYMGIPGQPLFDLNSLASNTIEAIEFFSGPAQTPAKYNSEAVCGVVVIWTRRK